MRGRWFISGAIGIVGALLMSTPALAARLQFWRFNPTENRLVFTTDSDVQPRAQLIANPTRLVIDLPGVVLGSEQITQSIDGAVREIRIGQFDPQTTRIVVELNPGYTIDPQQVEIRGSTPTQWTVQLPTPQPIDPSVAIATPAPTSPSTPTSPATSATPPALGAATQLNSFRITPDGFFIDMTGAAPEIDVDRSRRRRRLVYTLSNTAVAPQLLQGEQPINRYGVRSIEIEQEDDSPPTAQITLNLEDSDAEWQASVSTLGGTGLVLVPAGSGATPVAGDRPPVAQTPPSTPTASNAVIQAVEVTSDGGQLLIRSDRAIRFTSGWDRASNAYQILIPSAQLAENIVGPQLGSGSPLLNVRLRENSDQSVSILVIPAAGVRIGEVNQPSTQLLALGLQRSPQPSPSTPPTFSSGELPRAEDGRIVIVIDPGHGGPDPGAIGIGGLREIDIVLPVGLRVASLLQQQGVQVVLTRSQDIDLDLEPRVQIAERANADLFVSIHANAISLSRPDVNGIETYYYSDRGLQLARVIHNSMLQVPGVQDRGVRQARFYVIRNTSMPAVLLELGFVTGAQDARLLSDPDFREQMAVAIARGILLYVQQNF